MVRVEAFVRCVPWPFLCDGMPLRMLTKPLAMVHIPVDVLHLILELVDKASLIKICLVNKVFCSCSQYFLYRDIRIVGNHLNICKICQTLNESTHLAKRVRSFEITNCGYNVQLRNEWKLRRSLQNMTCLRSLRLDDPNFSILDGCTFKLDSFTSVSNTFDFGTALRLFLCSQPSLTDMKIAILNYSYVPELGPCLPNLTRIATHFSCLPHIIPKRPVNQVISYGSRSHNESVDLSFFTLSTAPIQKLAINPTYLYSAPLQLLASIFPSLTHLTLKSAPRNQRMVSEPYLFIYQ
jgi:hypothetical protein